MAICIRENMPSCIRAPPEAEVMRLTAGDLRKSGMADEIVRENSGLMRSLRTVLRKSLDELCGLDTAALIASRYEKYRKY
ncbi:hypothetical protein FACS1894217_15120 [Clostridia bacterium]|nr:hypothetical protein FACS1894217_15120 [Clostridia bacterium]